MTNVYSVQQNRCLEDQQTSCDSFSRVFPWFLMKTGSPSIERRAPSAFDVSAKSVICFRPQLVEWNETAALGPAFHDPSSELDTRWAEYSVNYEKYNIQGTGIRKYSDTRDRIVPNRIVVVAEIQSQSHWIWHHPHGDLHIVFFLLYFLMSRLVLAGRSR